MLALRVSVTCVVGWRGVRELAAGGVRIIRVLIIDRKLHNSKWEHHELYCYD